MKINKGFTLIELLVVIAIVGILSGFVIVSMSSAINAAKDAKIKSDIGTLSKALLVYAANNSTYPGGTGTTSDTYPCTIGGGTTRCTNLEANLAPYLTAIPKTPSNGFYTYSYSGTGPSFTLQSTLSTGSVYQYNSSSYFSTISYISTCAAATNTQVNCAPITISSTEEACKCTYLSGAGTTSWTVPNGVGQVQYLVVAGGGGGYGTSGDAVGGGGGGGGYRSSVTGELSGGGSAIESPLVVSTGNVIDITVGAGGNPGSNGGNSLFSTITSLGGGAGYCWGGAGYAGGSGGGGGGHGTGIGGAGTIGQGKNGGNGSNDQWWGAGGGGGAGVAGGVGSGSLGGNGGAGLTSNITHSAVIYAGGGGGGIQSTGSSGGGGGAGGGGAGGKGVTGTNGTNNYGGGGGGGLNGSYGGSGVVIFRYTHL
jgi:type II secretion system protein G